VDPWPANPASAPSRCRQAVSGSFNQKAALELGKRAREMEDQAPLWSGGIQGWFGHRNEIDSEGGELVERHHHIAQRSEEAVAAVDHQDLKSSQPGFVEKSIKLWSPLA
jgi:hypothetical protein